MLIMACTGLVVCTIIFADYRLVINKSFNNLEKLIIESEVQDTKRAFDRTLYALSLYGKAFSQWDDAYEFMEFKNQKFIKSNFVPGNFTTSNIDFLIYYDLKGNLYYGRELDTSSKTLVPISDVLDKYIQDNPAFLKYKSSKDQHIGILNSPIGLIVMVSQPVLTSDGIGPQRGSLLMGYYLNQNIFSNLSELVGQKLKFYPYSIIVLNVKLNDLYLKLIQSHGSAHSFVNDQLLQQYLLLKDINDKPVGILQIDIPRIIYKQGITTFYHYFFIIVLSGLLIMLLMWFFLKMFVLNRIISISKQVSRIDVAHTFHHPIILSGNDELNSLAQTINHMMLMIDKYHDQLHFMANYDHLTQLPNRQCFLNLLSNDIKNANNTHKKIAVIFLDLDKFKPVNDRYGHAIGDKLLQLVAKRIRKVIRASDILGRQSGDEFVLYLNDFPNQDFVIATAQRILDHCSRPFHIKNFFINITISIGIAIYPNDGLTTDQLIINADQAMYKIKAKKGNNFIFYNEIKELA